MCLSPFYTPVEGISSTISLEEAGDSRVYGAGGKHRRGGDDELHVI